MPERDYINPTTGLFSGLAEGIFGFRQEEEKRARETEDRTRKESLAVLTDLLDDATPETRPTLLRQIGDLMAFKGKERGIWDTLTGGGLDEGTRGIQSKLSAILGGIVPKKQIDAEALSAAMGGTPLSKRPQGRVVLRDPQQESLDKLRSQYELRSEADKAKITESERLRLQRELELEGERSRNRLAEQKQKTLDKAQAEVFSRASGMPGGLGDPLNIERARKAVAARYDLKDEELEARIGLIGAKTEESEANAAALRSSSIPGAKPLEVAKFGEQQASRYDPIFKSYNAATAKADALRSQISSIEQRAAAYGKGRAQPMDYDPATGQFTRGGKPVNTALMTMSAFDPNLAEDLSKLSSLRQQLVDSEAEAKGLAGQLEKAPNFYQRDPSGKIVPKAAAPVGTMRTDTTTSPTKSFFDVEVGGTILVDDAQPRKPGDTFEGSGGRVYEFVELVPSRSKSKIDKRWRVRRIQ